MLILWESIALAYIFRDMGLLLPPIKAILWNIGNFQDTWALHMKIQKNRVVNDSDILQMLAPFRIRMPSTENLSSTE